MIIDDTRKSAVIHPADSSYYMTLLTPEEFLTLRRTEIRDEYSALWTSFFPGSLHCPQREPPLSA